MLIRKDLTFNIKTHTTKICVLKVNLLSRSSFKISTASRKRCEWTISRSRKKRKLSFMSGSSDWLMSH